MAKNKLDQLLFKPELKSLGGGRTWSTLIFLGVIYSFALFSLGAGDQIRLFLKDQMEDEFVQLLSSTAPEAECRMVIPKLLGNEDLKRQFSISDIRLLAKDYQSIQGLNGESFDLLVGSYDDETTFKADDRLYRLDDLESVISELTDQKVIPQNWRSHLDLTKQAINDVGSYQLQQINVHPLWGMLQSDTSLFVTSAARCHPFNPLVKTGVILSAKAAENLGILDVVQQGDRLPMITWTQSDDTPVYLPVLGVTTSLPLEIDLAIHAETWGYLSEGIGQQHTTSRAYFVPDSKQGLLDSQYLPKSVPVPTGRIYSGAAFGEGMRLVKEVGNPIDLITFDEVDRSQFLALEHVTFKMEDLTKVRGFAKQLEDNKELYGCAVSDNHSTTLKIDLTDVEAKENLGIFSGFANLLSLALIVISLILIINYTGAILRLHINKNKKNLGTLTAFGYKNSTITRLYLKITATILSLSFVLSYLIVWPLGYLGFKTFLSVTGLSNSLSDVSFAHWPLYYSIPLFVLLPLVIVSVRIRKQLKATPGDLVYDR